MIDVYVNVNLSLRIARRQFGRVLTRTELSRKTVLQQRDNRDLPLADFGDTEQHCREQLTSYSTGISTI